MALAGQIVRAVDFTPPARAAVATRFDNFVTTGFEPTEPAVELTFTAPSSGIVRFAVSEQLDAETAVPTDRIQSDVEVRITDADGTVVHSPSVTDGQGVHHNFPTAGSIFTTHPGWRYLSGLNPGQTYWAQLQHTTANIDIEDQNLIVEGVW